MNKGLATSRFRRDALLPGNPENFLRKTGLRSTRQRIAVARLLLKGANRRVTAEILYDEAHEARCPVSRSAVCDALRQFEKAGLLRRTAIDRSKRSERVGEFAPSVPQLWAADSVISARHILADHLELDVVVLLPRSGLAQNARYTPRSRTAGSTNTLCCYLGFPREYNPALFCCYCSIGS
jgi:hypothetical protein